MTSPNRQSFFERIGIASRDVPAEVTRSQSSSSKAKFEFNFGLGRPETYGTTAVKVERDPTSNDRKLWRSKAEDQSLAAHLSPNESGHREADHTNQTNEGQHPTLVFALKKIRTYS
jgi:hypothetical protein